MQNLKNLRLHNYPFGDGDWRATDQFEQNDSTKETISELEQISKLSLYRSKGTVHKSLVRAVRTGLWTR